MRGLARAWKSTKNSRGAGLQTGLRKGGLVIGDLRDFMAKVDEAGISDEAVFRYTASNLNEGGSRSFALEASEDYELEVAA